jgi:hypothetical protein
MFFHESGSQLSKNMYSNDDINQITELLETLRASENCDTDFDDSIKEKIKGVITQGHIRDILWRNALQRSSNLFSELIQDRGFCIFLMSKPNELYLLLSSSPKLCEIALNSEHMAENKMVSTAALMINNNIDQKLTEHYHS